MRYLLSSLFFVLLLIACEQRVTDHLPTADELKEYYPHFISNPAQLESVYRNSDANAFLFLYTTSDEKILDTISAAAQKYKWTIRNRSESEIDLFRPVPPPDDDSGHIGGRGLIKVGVSTIKNRICVAWLNHSNNKFTKKYFWPKYEACMRGAGVVDTLLTEEEDKPYWKS